MIFETQHRTKQGRIFPVEVNASYLKLDGREYGCCFVRDISERKRGEEKVRESNELVRLVLDSVPEAVYGIDMEGNCTFCNPACLRLLGYDEPAQLYGKNMHDVMHHTRKDGTHYPWRSATFTKLFGADLAPTSMTKSYGAATAPTLQPNTGPTHSAGRKENRCGCDFREYHRAEASRGSGSRVGKALPAAV